MSDQFTTLARDTNQALGIGQYAIDFCRGEAAQPAQAVLDRVQQFHLDAVSCGVSAIAIGTNAPTLLRSEALQYGTPGGAFCFGSAESVMPEKAVAANCAAVREWDANGTNFGFNPARSDTSGEFGHNDFYSVAIAAATVAGLDGRRALLGMLCIDEIRGRLAEVFSLKDHKIDHVVHGAIASAAIYGAMTGATAQEIESALGTLVAHYIPFRAIRAGKQLSDSKGASAAISAEAAVLSMRRATAGFVGPADIFRNPQAIFCLFEPPAQTDESPFDLVLTNAGDDFAVMGMHFKLGVYEHQSAGAIAGLIELLVAEPQLVKEPNELKRIRITIYEPAFSIICDPAKRDPQVRQSADHSMVYIIATLLRKAYERRTAGWSELMLMPTDYDQASLFNPLTRSIMSKIEFEHGGEEYDAKYPDGIPTRLVIEHGKLGTCDSGLVMYPTGHARAKNEYLLPLLKEKFRNFASLAVDDVDELLERLSGLSEMSAAEVAALYDFKIRGIQ